MKLLLFLLLILGIQIINGDLYTDFSLKGARFDAFIKDPRAGNIAVGNVEGLELELKDEVAILTTKEIWHGWHHASLGDIPPTVDINSYITFSDVETIKFKIKSTEILSSEIKIYIELKAGGFGIDRKLIDLGYDDITDWTEIKLNVLSFRAIKLKLALGLSLNGGELDRTMQVKDISFLTKSGENANILENVSWPKEQEAMALLKKLLTFGTKSPKMELN